MELQTILGSVAGILTAISSLPQLVKMIKEKKARYIGGDGGYVITGTGILGLVWPVAQRLAYNHYKQFFIYYQYSHPCA